MQLATVVTINDLGYMTGIVESVEVYDDLTVYGVRTLCGMLYARTADELGAPSQPALLSFVRDLRILAAAHAELRKAVDLLDADAMTYGLIVAAGRSGAAPQIRAWYVRHGLDKLPHPTAADILAARDVDRATAEAINRTYDLLARIARESGGTLAKVEPAAAERAPRVRRRNRLVINGEQIA